MTHHAVRDDRLVYVVVANKSTRYPHGDSRIVYIGTTKLGVHRIASSTAWLACEMFDVHGVWKLDVYVVTCRRRQKVKTWRKLERGLLLMFRQDFGDVPRCNYQGTNMRWTDERDYFTEQGLRAAIQTYTDG